MWCGIKDNIIIGPVFYGQNLNTFSASLFAALTSKADTSNYTKVGFYYDLYSFTTMIVALDFLHQFAKLTNMKNFHGVLSITMVILSGIQIILYTIDIIKFNDSEANGPIARALEYNPYKKDQIWRYITYMFVHMSITHLCSNIIAQNVFGRQLELVHTWRQVIIIYFSGGLAGALGTSFMDPTVSLVGASGGVYALITALFVSVIMNWEEMPYPFVLLVFYLVIIVTRNVLQVYERYYLQVRDNTGVAAHVAGAMVGLLVGICVLRTSEVTSYEEKLWWESWDLYIGLISLALFLLARLGFFLKNKLSYDNSIVITCVTNLSWMEMELRGVITSYEVSVGTQKSRVKICTKSGLFGSTNNSAELITSTIGTNNQIQNMCLTVVSNAQCHISFNFVP